jgi:hypothetical protein
MTIQLSVTVRNNRLDQIELQAGAAPKFMLFSGAVPANCAQPDPAGTLANFALPSDWMNGASAGTKTLAGTWTGVATGNGTAASFRIKDPSGVTCHIQGTVGTTGTDLILDNNVLAIGQTINVTVFTFTDGNA